MHLLQAQPGEISDGTEPVDPGQSPADLVVISAADTEIALLSEARAALGPEAPTLRLAHLGWLAHPFSVDKYLTDTAVKARLVIARILGGEAYWGYGLEQFRMRLAAANVPFVALPGDDRPDAALIAASSVGAQDHATLHAYLVEGGSRNAANFLSHAKRLIEGGEAAPPPAEPLPRAGLHWPGRNAPDLDALKGQWRDGAPVAALVFYRALMMGAGLDPVDRLIEALGRRGLNPLPIFVSSLKDAFSAEVLSSLFETAPPSVVLNATSFAVSSPQAPDRAATPLDAPGRPVLQIIFSGGTETAWAEGARGLSARDIAMNVALPEVDGRLLAGAVSFKAEARYDPDTECPIAAYRARPDRIDFAADLAAGWARLQQKTRAARRIGIVLANYPNRDGRLANGVGLDTPAGTIETVKALAAAGYLTDGAPQSGAALMEVLLAGPTNWLPDRAVRSGGARLPLDAYRAAYDALPATVRARIEDRWGAPENDPFFADGAFALSLHRFGNIVIGVQPARGYNIDPKETHHSPDLVPPHGYFAFYFWLRREFGADALIHMGKHGNLEWLPGKAVALSKECLPEAALGPLPHLYPFIVNDPGEGTQAKRRTCAAIIDHLTPPLTRAETYGPLKELEALVDEYFEASGVDSRRLGVLGRDILDLAASSGLDADAGIAGDDAEETRLSKLDAYLCELKEAQIRDGLHVFGLAPEGRLETDLVVALARIPRGPGDYGDQSLIRALAQDLGLCGNGFDPLDCSMSAPWSGPRPDALVSVSDDPWRSTGDTVERLELLAAALVAGEVDCAAEWAECRAVLAEIETRIRPAVAASGKAELAAVIDGLDGRFIAPGPSGAPTRGRLDVLPTGRNFYSVDTRAVPTPAAYELGAKSAERLIERYVQEEGDWPKTMVVTAWGTANMRTGGDDIAQALALIGVRPCWDNANRRVTGFEIIPTVILGRPRVDVTLRISGFFRDAFPGQIDLFDSAARAVMSLNEPEADNPLAARYAREKRTLGAERAGYRVFGSKPGAYGAGLQALIDEKLWADRADLAEAYLEWGGYAYGGGTEGARDRATFERRLAAVEAVVQNQDNREHDLLDSDDYYQFEGGVAATVEHLRGEAPKIFHNDHSRPERPVIRTLDEEIGRVLRARVVNPKWIAGVRRHGYKGAAEIAATVDYLFAFAATTAAVKDHHFDLAYDAFLGDDEVRDFIGEANPAALREIAERFGEAISRGLWQPKSNSARAHIERLCGTMTKDEETP